MHMPMPHFACPCACTCHISLPGTTFQLPSKVVNLSSTFHQLWSYFHQLPLCFINFHQVFIGFLSTFEGLSSICHHILINLSLICSSWKLLTIWWKSDKFMFHQISIGFAWAFHQMSTRCWSDFHQFSSMKTWWKLDEHLMEMSLPSWNNHETQTTCWWKLDQTCWSTHAVICTCKLMKIDMFATWPPSDPKTRPPCVEHDLLSPFPHRPFLGHPQLGPPHPGHPHLWPPPDLWAPSPFGRPHLLDTRTFLSNFGRRFWWKNFAKKHQGCIFGSEARVCFQLHFCGEKQTPTPLSRMWH